jgi:hypothetical protein
VLIIYINTYAYHVRNSMALLSIAINQVDQ